MTSLEGSGPGPAERRWRRSAACPRVREWP